MIIDIHTHIFNQESWLSYQAKAGNTDIKVISLPWFRSGKPGWSDVRSLIKFTDIQPQVFALGAMDMDRDLDGQLEFHKQLFQQGKILGIKLYPGYQHFYPSDPKVVEIAGLCQQFNKPLVFHSGDVYDTDQVALIKYAHPLHIDDLARNCPQTKIVISHFGFPYQLETAMLVSQHTHVYTDISGTIDDCGSEPEIKSLNQQYIADLRRAFQYYPQVKKKTLFATDFLGEYTPLNQVQPYIEVINKTIDQELQDHAFFKLAQQVYFS